MIDSTEKGDSILFYFAGHGVKEDEKGYLLLADSKASDFQGTALDLAKINEILRKSNTDSFMILDACHSGVLARNAFTSSVSDIISDTGCITLASCSANEESHPYQEMEQGVFTYYLCEEIKRTSLGEPVLLKAKMEVCNSVMKWAKKNYKIQNATLNGQIVGNKAFACRNHNEYSVVEDPVLLGKKRIIDNMSNFLKNFASAIDSEMEKIGRDESNIVEENEPQLLYTSVIRKWLEENSELQIENILPENKDWRVLDIIIFIQRTIKRRKVDRYVEYIEKYNYSMYSMLLIILKKLVIIIQNLEKHIGIIN